jgi:hypothetical protein
LTAIDLPNLTKLIETVMAIPISNDFVERVFSTMKKIWSNDRNRLNVNMVKAEICTKVNFSINCNDFKTFVINNNQLIRASKISTKYKINK